MKKKVIVDLLKYRQELYNTGIKNGEVANTIYIQFFTIIMTTALAELAFIGTFELNSKKPSLTSVWSATILLASMLLMAISMFRQKSEMSRGSRYFFELSQKTDEYMKNERQNIYDTVPTELVIDQMKLRPGRLNRLIMAIAFLGLIIATALILLVVWKKAI